jgi:hypothetical protein
MNIELQDGSQDDGQQLPFSLIAPVNLPHDLAAGSLHSTYRESFRPVSPYRSNTHLPYPNSRGS